MCAFIYHFKTTVKRNIESNFASSIYIHLEHIKSQCFTSAVKFTATALEMFLIVVSILLATGQLSISQIGKNRSWQTERWVTSLQKPQERVTYVSDSKYSLHPFCYGPWTIDSGNGSCECGSSLKGLVHCDNSSFNLQLLPCYCMTPYEKDPNITVVGACLYKCNYQHGRHYYSVPAKDPYSLSEFMCGEVARDGQLCGQCELGFSPSVYSYDWHCLNCTLYDNYVKQLAKYITVAFIPLTVFFIVMTTLHISATSPSINAFILLSQLLTAPVILRAYTHTFVQLKHNVYTERVGVVSFFASLYGIWNLDFFRTLYPPFCLHPSINTLQLLALEYTIAAYPLFLIMITYALVEMHDRNFNFVVWLWKPFRRCFILFRRHWDVKTSLVDAFGTFLLLSYVKFLSASFDLLTPVHLYNAHGETINETYLYYDATIQYFSRQHLPYAALAIMVLILFNLLPIVLLCLYPCQCFQKLLNCCRLRCTALHTFMDTFQGCYRNRTDSTYDCRWFSAVYLIIRIAFHLVVAVTQDMKLFFLFAAAVLAFTVLLIGVVQPYKSPVYNRLDMVLIQVVAMGYLFIPLYIIAKTEHHEFTTPTAIIATTFGILPLVYIIAISMHWLVIRKTVPQRLYHRVCKFLPFKRLVRQRNLEEQLPDRLANPEECAALLRDPMAVDQYCDATPDGLDLY